MKKKIVFMFIALSLLFTGSLITVDAFVGVDLGNASILTTKEFGVPLDGTTSEHAGKTIIVKYEFTDSNNAIDRIEYYETSGNQGWKELNDSDSSGHFGNPYTGFQYPTTKETSRFRIFASTNAGTITGQFKVMLFGTDTVLETYDIKLDVVSPTVDIIGVKDTYTLGETIDFSVAIDAKQDFLDLNYMVKGSGVIDFNPEDADMEYFNDDFQEWLPYTDPAFGPVNGFPFTPYSSDFRLTPKATGTYSGRIDIISANDPSIIIASQEFSFNVVEQSAVVDDNKKDDEKKDATPKATNGPKTGDHTNLVGFSALMLIAGAVLVSQLKKENA